MRDLLVSLPPGLGPRAGLEAEIRSAVRSGRLIAGTAMPSTRTLAADLGIARSTVVAAYEQLAIEGYLRAEQGRATTVAEIRVPQASEPDHNPIGARFAHDFRPGEPALGSFPRRGWQQSLRRAVMESPDDAFGYGDPRGRLELRTALASYLARVRGVHVNPGGVRIYGGFASSLGFIGEMLRRCGIERIAVEQPMLGFHRQILHLAGVETVPVAVDKHGLRVEDMVRHGVRAVMATPGNQQPLGVTMSSRRRSALVEWANTNDGWIIEDDYDGEFRYDRHPIAALQGLDPDRVLYAGTASKSMAPGLHLSWLVVPQQLRADLAAVTHLRAAVSTISQLAMADFVDRGAYDQHVRRQRRLYQRRRGELAERLAAIPWLDIAAGHAGMHLVTTIAGPGIVEATVIEHTNHASVGVTGLVTHFDHHTPGLVLNVSRPANHQFAASSDALLGALAAVPYA